MHAHPEALCFHIARNAMDGIDNEANEFMLAQRIMTVIVFSALTLETFINQQAGVHALPRARWRKLSAKNKWKKFPILLGMPRTFDEGAEPFKGYSALISLRNDVVHFGPGSKTAGTVVGEQFEFFSNVVKDKNLASTYFAVVEAMIMKLDELTNQKTGRPRFLAGEKYLTTISTDYSMPTELLSKP
jgi:hypothetical protein